MQSILQLKKWTPMIFWNNFPKTEWLSMIFQRIIIHLPTNYGWKLRHRSRTSCTVFIATVAHCRIPCTLVQHSAHSFNSETLNIRKHLALFQQNYGCLTIRTFTPSISLQDLGWHVGLGACVQEANTRISRVAEVWADFEQSIVEKAIDQWRKRLWACVKAKDCTLTYATICDAMHCLNGYIVLNDHCFSQQ